MTRPDIAPGSRPYAETDHAAGCRVAALLYAAEVPARWEFYGPPAAVIAESADVRRVRIIVDDDDHYATVEAPAHLLDRLMADLNGEGRVRPPLRCSVCKESLDAVEDGEVHPCQKCTRDNLELGEEVGANREREACALLVCPNPPVEETRSCAEVAESIRARGGVPLPPLPTEPGEYIVTRKGRPGTWGAYLDDYGRWWHSDRLLLHDVEAALPDSPAKDRP
jgi:hypothetical protein